MVMRSGNLIPWLKAPGTLWRREGAWPGGGVYSQSGRAGKLSCPYLWIEFRSLDCLARILVTVHTELPADVYQFLDIHAV